MIYFIRHGQSQANVDNVFSSADSQITEKGREQARLAGEKMKADGIVIDNIVSSTYDRAVDTAKIIADVIGFDIDKIKYDPKLVEYNAGELIDKSESGVTAQQVAEAKGAEDLNVLKSRVEATLAEVRLLPGDSLIISHAGIGRMINIIKTGFDPKLFYTIRAYPNCQIIVLE